MTVPLAKTVDVITLGFTAFIGAILEAVIFLFRGAVAETIHVLLALLDAGELFAVDVDVFGDCFEGHVIRLIVTSNYMIIKIRVLRMLD